MPLRPQQETFEQVIRDAYRRVRHVLAVAPTGFGKGFIIADMAFKAAGLGRLPMVVTNRRVIVKQIQKECQRAGLRVGIIMGSEEPDPEAQVQVASIQTLKRRDFYGMPKVGFCIIDECVSGDAWITTENGPVQIRSAHTANFVMSYGNKGVSFQRIRRWIRRGRQKTIQLNFASGRSIRTTPEHLIATTEGWVESRCLTPQHKIICVNADAVRQPLRASGSARGTGASSIPNEETIAENFGNQPRRFANAVVDYKSTFSESPVTANTSTDTTSGTIEANSTPSNYLSFSDARFSALFSAIRQSDTPIRKAQHPDCMELTGFARESGLSTKLHISRHSVHRWKLSNPKAMGKCPVAGEQGPSSASVTLTQSSNEMAESQSAASGSVALAESGLHGGYATMEVSVVRAIFPFTLKDTRFASNTSSKDGSKTPTAPRRFRQPIEVTTSCDCQPKRKTGFLMQSASSFQTACGTSFDTLLSTTAGEDEDVYDLDVDQTHCFFANDTLVHNCHQEPAAYAKMIEERLAGVPVLGLTATPVGPGGARLGHFQEIVEPVRNTEVIATGDLLKVHPYIAPFEPDMDGINLKSASRDEVGNRVEECKIYADVFKHWEPYSDQQTLAILPSIATANTFLHQCMSRNISARLIDGGTAQDERDEAFGEFEDETTRVLISVDVLREGFNAPNARVLLDIQPTHQFRVFWQKVGRVKRPHEGQETAVVLDFAGNLGRHMVHPDQDPPWGEVTNDTTIEEINERRAGVRCPKCGSKDIYSIEKRYKCESCKHEWETKKPFVCPRCAQALGPHQRIINGECPNCRQKVGSRPMKRIRYADGKMRVVTADEVIRRKKSKANAEQAAWDQCRFIAHHTGKTLDFARVLYKQKMGKWPPDGLKYCPDNPLDWKRRPAEVYPWMKKKGK